MPCYADHTIRWSSQTSGYEVVHGPFSFPLSGDGGLQTWLTNIDTCRFCLPTGETLTLRKERKQRGSGYWYAYKQVGEKVHKCYIGGKQKVTLSLLEALASQFVGTEVPPPSPPPRTPTLIFRRNLESALQIFGLATIPGKKTLILRYRELSKQHHPDMGGLHEDMVAVNLAYDYLKKFL